MVYPFTPLNYPLWTWTYPFTPLSWITLYALVHLQINFLNSSSHQMLCLQHWTPFCQSHMSRVIKTAFTLQQMCPISKLPFYIFGSSTPKTEVCTPNLTWPCRFKTYDLQIIDCSFYSMEMLIVTASLNHQGSLATHFACYLHELFSSKTLYPLFCHSHLSIVMKTSFLLLDSCDYWIEFTCLNVWCYTGDTCVSVLCECVYDWLSMLVQLYMLYGRGLQHSICALPNPFSCNEIKYV